MTDTEHDKLHARFKELHQAGEVLLRFPLKSIPDQSMILDARGNPIVTTDFNEGHTQAYFETWAAEYLLAAVAIATEEVLKS